MKKFFRYFVSRLRCHFKSSPGVLAVAIVTALAVALAAGALIRRAGENEDKNELLRVGISGNLDQRYVDLVIDTMNDLDPSVLSVDFIRIDDEEEAMRRVRSGELLGYLRVPDGFVDAAERGDFIPAYYVTEGTDTAFGESIVREFMTVVQSVADSAQRGVFGLGRYLDGEEVSEEEYNELTDSLALEYADALLTRSDALDVRVIGDDGGVTVGVYYFVAFSLFFAFLFGIGCAPHIVKRDMSLPRLLSSARLGAPGQAVAETLAYFIFCGLFTSFIFILGGAVAAGGEISSYFGASSVAPFALYAVRVMPAILMISAFQIFLYECVTGLVSGVLLQFVASISVSYISGFFYPSSFFPESVQKIAAILPGGAAFTYAKCAFTGRGAMAHILPVLAWCAFFVAATALIRRKRIGGEDA